MREVILALALLAAARSASAADRELGIEVGRTADSQETDLVRLGYRRPFNLEGVRAATTRA